LIIAGIDPGVTGAVAFYDPDGPSLEVIDFPIFMFKRGRSTTKDLNAIALADLIRARMTGADHVFVEKVHALPGQGVCSTFKFGTVYGTIIGILADQKIPTTFVTPQQWKKAMRVTADKEAARLRASQLLPNYVSLWPNRKDHNRAEAALIALYGSQQLKQDNRPCETATLT